MQDQTTKHKNPPQNKPKTDLAYRPCPKTNKNQQHQQQHQNLTNEPIQVQQKTHQTPKPHNKPKPHNT